VKNAKIVKFEHSELGTLEVLVTGTREFETLQVYYGAYNVTRDLSDEDRLKILKQLSSEEDTTNANG
jgi:hypothetical protein